MIGALIGGLGILVYLVCWLIIPQEGEQPGDLSSGWIVAVAKACAACLGLATLAVLAAVATLFGFGWVAVAAAAAVLVAVLVWWPKLSPAWALLPIAAIALPSATVAASGVELAAQPGNEIIAPKSLSANGVVTFRAGTGTMLIDLRRTLLPPAGVVAVHIQGGVRRTIVALPHGRCVHVSLSYHVRPFLSDLASQVVGRPPFPGVIVFGRGTVPRVGVYEPHRRLRRRRHRRSRAEDRFQLDRRQPVRARLPGHRRSRRDPRLARVSRLSRAAAGR